MINIEGINETIKLVQKYAIRDIYPCHCTHPGAINMLRQALGDRLHPLAVGFRVTF